VLLSYTKYSPDLPEKLNDFLELCVEALLLAGNNRAPI
jgi:hypothetical protein